VPLVAGTGTDVSGDLPGAADFRVESSSIPGKLSLSQLDLRDTRVTEAGVERLQKVLPECKIRYVGSR
jgi:hypothetical protein